MRPLSRLAALSVLLTNACYPAGDGKPPPLDQLYFPTGVAIDGFAKSEDGGPKYLYVVNSDFDLQYRSASVISYDLGLLRKLVPQGCRSEDDCSDGKLCDAPGAQGLNTAPPHVPSYYCVDPNDPLYVDPTTKVPKPCGPFGERDDADVVLNPGRCKSLNPSAPEDHSESLVVDTVGIGAFATDVLWRENPNPGSMYPSRLFIPVRGDSTLHWIDIKNETEVEEGRGQFWCGQNGDDDNACDAEHRSGDTPSDNLDLLRQPSEPYALDATGDGAFVAITNQTSGSVSLFHNDWSPQAGPELVSILGGLPLAPIGIAAVPEPDLSGGQWAPGFLVAYRNAPQIDLLRVRDDQADTGALPPPAMPGTEPYNRYALRRAGSVPISANSLGFDSRGIAIDDWQRRQDYEQCDASAAACAASASTDAETAACQKELSDCRLGAQQPGVYVASRAPASLLVGAMTADPGYPAGTSELPSFTDSIALTFGPSRAILGQVRVPGTSSSVLRDQAGPYELESRVFVVCFDSRRIFVYDPKRRAIDAMVSTGRGPYALAVDGARGLAYLGHFTDSYLGVISLDQRFPQTYATIVASIGTPKAPRSSK